MSTFRRFLRFARRLIRRSIPAGGILERTIKSGVWVSALNVCDRALQLVMMVVLARLLTPRDFGLLGIALLTLGTLRQFSELGLEAAIIQQEEENIDHYLNTAWSLEAARGLLLASICFLAAPYIASFFGEPRTTDILRVIGLAPLFHGLRNPAVIYFKKELDFHKQFMYRISGSLSNFSFAFVYALMFKSVWALILGYVIGQATRTMISYFMHDYRPWPDPDLSITKELINYGKWITGSQIAFFLYDRGDDIVVGWLLTATSLGWYQMAYRLSNAPATEVTGILSSVMFPAYSQLQDNIASLREAYFRTIQITMLISFPMAIGILLVTPHFVELALGPDWLPMVTTMQLFAIYGLIRAFVANNGPVWKSLGRPDYIAKLSFLRIVIMGIFIYPAILWFGIEGAAVLIVAHTIIPILPLNIYLIVDITEMTYRRYAREVSYPLTACMGMAGAVLAVDWFVPIQSTLIEFIALIAVGAGAYAVMVLILEKQFSWGLEHNLRSAIQAAKG